MTGLLFIFVICIYLSIFFEKTIAEVLPPFVFTLLVGLYYLAIIGYAHHSFFLSVMASFIVLVMFFVKFRRIIPTKIQLTERFSIKGNIGLYIYIIVCIVMAYCYHDHFVLGWDDFHYNATFPKDMWYFGTMPKGIKSTTYYKDYFPTLQLFFYWGFQSIRRFSEPLMFIYKIILAYTCMLPFFEEINKGTVVKRCISAVVAIILPYLALIEILDSLSMDACLAIIFSYAVISMLSDSEKDWFFYYRIIIALNALVLFKSYALIFACIALLAWFIVILIFGKDIKEPARKKAVITDMLFLAAGAVSTIISYMSWKIFCRRNGNSTYLSGILSDNIKNGTNIKFPDYAHDTVINILKSLATMHLNFGKLGFTVLSAVVFCIILVVIMLRCRICNKRDIAAYIVVLCGFAGFVLFLIYSYIFIFEDWEAYELSSLDRYLGTCVQMMLYIVLFKLVLSSDNNSFLRYTAVVSAVICLATLNYPRIADALIHERYMAGRMEAYNVKNEVKDEVEEIALTLDNHRGRVLVACNESNSLYSRNMDYYFIPTPTITYDSGEYEKGQLAEELLTKYDRYDGEYLYFTKRLSEDECFSEFEELMADGTELSTGKIYTLNDDGLFVLY